jgi:carboxyl-terminal processing protease
MKLFRIVRFQIILALLLPFARFASAEPDPGQISISVGRLLEQGHYTKRKLDDDLSRQLLKNYLEALDYNHLFFTQADVDKFTSKYAAVLDDDILLGNPNPAFEIYNLFQKRVEDRVAKIKEQLKQDFHFTGNRSIELNRQKSPWPKDDAEADQLWADRVEGEYLQEKLAEHPIDPPVKVLTRRYDQLLRNLHEQTREDILKTFLTTLALTYDPHSEYLSKSDLENFSINMRLSLVGIGAVLHSEDGYAKIMDLVPGGPAQTDGRLKVGDRVTAVAQGDKEFSDVVGMKLDKVVEMIRGKKGTTVRLQVIPSHATDPSARKLIEIVRDEVKLKDAEAKAEIIESTSGGVTQRLGWITLPSFYADMDHSGAQDAKSTSKDVLKLLIRLKQENVGGVVIDLRRNGGGSLDEAIRLTSLFIPDGHGPKPVVQTKNANGSTSTSKATEPACAYDGPLVILTNRLSASASEIFAAALQDYSRAVIVGDQNTFGKGSVQTMIEIGRYIPFLGSDSSDAGALKLTIQKFYRIAGGSTQLRGVTSDIRLPSLYDHPDIGESALKNPMPYDEVSPVAFEKITDHPLYIKELKTRSAGRVGADPEFRYVMDDLNLLKKKIADNKISLNEKVRRTELADQKSLKEKRTAAREKQKHPDQKVYQITLDNADKSELELVKNDKKDAAKDAAADAGDEDEDAGGKADSKSIDPIRVEALRILSDLIELSRAPKTASVTK